MARYGAGIGLLLLASGCLGAKSGLWEPPDVPPSEAGVREDARAEDAGEVEVRDDADAAELPDVRDVFDADLCGTSCDDGLPCTDDSCDPARGCVHLPVDGRCDDGVACTLDGCEAGVGCTHLPQDASCGDGIECTADRCDPATGCTSVADLALCDDGFDCTADGCNWVTGRCTHVPSDAACDDRAACTTDRCEAGAGCAYHPDDWLCPAYEHCDVVCHGCAIDLAMADHFLAFTEESLFRIDLFGPSMERMRAMGVGLTGLAITPDQQL
jgi:hypothetical protein